MHRGGKCWNVSECGGMWRVVVECCAMRFLVLDSGGILGNVLKNFVT